MREVRIIDSSNLDEVRDALARALSGDGPAILIRDSRAQRLAAQGSEKPLVVSDTIAILIQTSGSAGAPKTVGISADAIIANANATHRRLGGPGQWLLALPVSYIAGISVLVRSIVAQNQPAVMLPGPFDPQSFCEEASSMTGSRNYTALVPVQLARLLDFIEDNPEYAKSLRNFDAILIGGQSLEQSLRARAQSAELQIVSTYGSSETCGGCVYDGIPLDDVDIAIDETTGEILISGPMLAEGYEGNDALTAETFHIENKKRWYHTRDTGFFTNGVLTVSGRLDRVVISGGLNISLDAVEAAIHLETSYKQVVAINIPDSEWGNRPGVVVEAKPENTDQASAEIYDAIVRVMGRVAAPKNVIFVEKLPRLTSGKPDLQACARLAAVED